MRKNRAKCQIVFNALKDRSSSKWYLDNGCSRHMIGDKAYFTSLEDYNGETVTFGDGSLACVKGKESISIPTCLYVDGLKKNLLRIS